MIHFPDMLGRVSSRSVSRWCPTSCVFSLYGPTVLDILRGAGYRV
jgi:hypothetical protein